MGIGVNAGEVVVGSIGYKTRAKYGIVGSPANITSGIQSVAEVGEVVLSESAYRHTAPEFVVKKFFQVQLKGIQEPETLYVAERLSTCI